MRTTVAVTGASGFIGTHLVAGLKETGCEVLALDAVAPKERLTKVTYARRDICNREHLQLLFSKIDAVIHLAARPRVQDSLDHPDETHLVNGLGTLNLLMAAQQAGVRRAVFVSSSSVYGDRDDIPLTEDMLPKPESFYGADKLAGEHYARIFATAYGERNLETVSLRLFNVYGPDMDPDGPYALVVPKFIKMRVGGRPMTITGDGTQTRDFTHVRDVVRAMILAARSPKVGRGEVINVGAGRNVSVNCIAELIGGPVVYIDPRHEPHDTLADTTRARDLLGWRPEVSTEEGIDELKRLAGLS